jgi:5-methylcytosine-specific restriction endonuclease McrA
MIYEENSKYYRICDDCGDIKEIQRQTYRKNLEKEYHYCLSCCQKGERNHQYGKSAWNKGLTKEVDERVKKYGELCSETKKGYEPWNKGFTYEELKGKEWSDDFKRKVSKVKTGKPNYKRRTSMNRRRTYTQIMKSCRALLYTEWKRKILERDEFKCTKCGTNKELEVHHLRPFREIIRLIAKKMNIDLDNFKDITDEEYAIFRDNIVKEHKLEDGITLCKKCHMDVDECRRIFYE